MTKRLKPMLVDTHAHLHFDSYQGEVDAMLHQANEDGVKRIITVGVDTADSRSAVELATRYQDVWASVGIHPHNADEAEQGISYISDLAGEKKVVAIGECGLDYFKSQVDTGVQKKALRLQIELAQATNKPAIFHIREASADSDIGRAFDDFYNIVDEYPGLRGVVHCFSSTTYNMQQAVSRGLYVALNGIMTFTKDEEQLAAAKAVPLGKLLLETDAPFLAPAPKRGKRNEPAKIKVIAEFLAELRGESVRELSAATTQNAHNLFGIPV